MPCRPQAPLPPVHNRLALLRLLLGQEQERLETWARPLEPEKKHREQGAPAAQWHNHTRTAWDTDPTLALNLLDRCALACFHRT